MSPIQWFRLGLLALTLFGFLRLGMSLKQAEWDRTENKRLTMLTEALKTEQGRVDDLNELISDSQLRLAESEQNARELNDRLQEEIAREPVVTTITVEREGCPDIDISLPDAGQHFRLFNCGIASDCQTNTAEAGSGNGELRGTVPVARLDGNGGLIRYRNDF